MQMAALFGRRTMVVSSVPFAASNRGAPIRPATIASDAVVRNRRRVCIIGILLLPSANRHCRARPGNPVYASAFAGVAWMPGSSPGMTVWTECSRLQLAFELVEKAPVGALGDDLLRVGFDETQFMQPKGVVPDRVLGVVFPPFVVGDIAQRLQREVVASGETPVDQPLRDGGRVAGAEVRRLQDGAEHALCRDRMLLHI